MNDLKTPWLTGHADRDPAVMRELSHFGKFCALWGAVVGIMILGSIWLLCRWLS